MNQAVLYTIQSEIVQYITCILWLVIECQTTQTHPSPSGVATIGGDLDVGQDAWLNLI